MPLVDGTSRNYQEKWFLLSAKDKSESQFTTVSSLFLYEQEVHVGVFLHRNQSHTRPGEKQMQKVFLTVDSVHAEAVSLLLESLCSFSNSEEAACMCTCYFTQI